MQTISFYTKLQIRIFYSFLQKFDHIFSSKDIKRGLPKLKESAYLSKSPPSCRIFWLVSMFKFQFSNAWSSPLIAESWPSSFIELLEKGELTPNKIKKNWEPLQTISFYTKSLDSGLKFFIFIFSKIWPNFSWKKY